MFWLYAVAAKHRVDFFLGFPVSLGVLQQKIELKAEQS